MTAQSSPLESITRALEGWARNIPIQAMAAAVLAALEADGHDIHSPCCTACKGTGSTGDPDTNGVCWDCRGTGHAHERESWREAVES